MRANEKLDREVAGIGDLTRDELTDRWSKIYDCPPPSGVRRELLSHAIAWDLQAKRLGGLSPETRKAVKLAVARIGSKIEAASQASAASQYGLTLKTCSDRPAAGATILAGPPIGRSVPQPGARLVREWNGRTNVVDVVKNGFLFEGKTHRSLSAIARKITGAHWSGPRFFGL